MDPVALRLEQIRFDLQTNERLVDLLARRHIAVFSVGLTTFAASAAGFAVGQFGILPTTLVAAASSAILISQVRALGRLAFQLLEGRRQAQEAMETLIAQEVQPHADGPQRE